MSRLISCARNALGSIADDLIDRGAIVPMNISDDGVKKTPATAWKGPVDPSRDWSFNALALKTGEVSGITVIDFDAVDPVGSNVSTRRGGHIWVPWNQDCCRAGVLPHVDVRGDKGLAIFSSQFHNVNHTTLHKQDAFKYILDAQVSIQTIDLSLRSEPRAVNGHISLVDHIKNNTVNTVKSGELSAYCAILSSRGYFVDVEWAMKRVLGQMKKAREGTRNITLYRSVSTALLIGGDARAVVNAAYCAGLDWPEITKTFWSASKGASAVDTYQYAMRWQESALSALNGKTDVVDQLVKCCIEQWNTEPLFNQTAASQTLQISSRTVFRRLNALEEQGLLIKRANGFNKVLGICNPNNYKLALPSVSSSTCI